MKYKSVQKISEDMVLPQESEKAPIFSRRDSYSMKYHTTIERSNTRDEFKKQFNSPRHPKPDQKSNHYRQVSDTTMSPESVKARVFSEYFSMIDDWVMVADKRLNIISNNYSAKIVDNVINRFNTDKKRINTQNLLPGNEALTLDECFKFVEKEQMRCSKETVMNLIDIYGVLGFKQKKYVQEEIEKFKEANVFSILKKLEVLDSGIKLSNQQEEHAEKSVLKKINMLKSSMRAIYVKNSNLIVDLLLLGM